MKIPTSDEFLAAIDAFRERHNSMAESRFGRNATGEPQLLDSIRNGRSPSLKVMQKISDFMDNEDQKLATLSAGKTEIVPPEQQELAS